MTIPNSLRTAAAILTAFAGLLVGIPAYSQEAPPLRAELGRCHMDACSWSIILGREPKGSNANGNLYELLVEGGTSSHPNGSYSGRAKIEWDKATHPTWIFCSKTLPAIMFKADGGLYVTILNMSGDTVIGAHISATRMYLDVCHSLRGNYDLEREIKKLRYAGLAGDPSDIEKSIKEPADILKVNVPGTAPDPHAAKQIVDLTADRNGRKECSLKIDGESWPCELAWFIEFNSGKHGIQFNRGTGGKPVVLFLGQASGNALTVNQINLQNQQTGQPVEGKALGTCVLGNAAINCTARLADGRIAVGEIKPVK